MPAFRLSGCCHSFCLREHKVLRFMDMDNVGKCMNVGGDVYVRSQSLGDGPLVHGAYIQVEDEILTTDGAFAHIEFLDGSKFALSENTQLSVDVFCYRHEQHEDTAHFTIPFGKFVCISGQLSTSIDDFTIQANRTALSLRSARIASRIENTGDDLVTLLPQKTGLVGEVLAHTKAAVASIDRVYQTLRFGSVGADLSMPLTLPSQVVTKTYMGPGLECAFIEPATNEADVIDVFQPFDVLSDQFLERQFVSTHVYPSDIMKEESIQNDLLEDAFSGERFRLRDGER